MRCVYFRQIQTCFLAILAILVLDQSILVFFPDHLPRYTLLTSENDDKGLPLNDPHIAIQNGGLFTYGDTKIELAHGGRQRLLGSGEERLLLVGADQILFQESGLFLGLEELKGAQGFSQLDLLALPDLKVWQYQSWLRSIQSLKDKEAYQRVILFYSYQNYSDDHPCLYGGISCRSGMVRKMMGQLGFLNEKKSLGRGFIKLSTVSKTFSVPILEHRSNWCLKSLILLLRV